MNLYRRRVQLTGGSTFIVSLPKEWASSIGLRPGSEVEIEPMPDGSLLLRPSGAPRRRAERRRVLRVHKGMEGVLVTEILSAYLAGYDSIIVEYERSIDPRSVARAVEEARRRTIGLEVMDEDYGRITLSTITGPPTISTSKAFERMATVTRSMLDNICQALERPEPSLLESVVERDTIVDRFFLLIMRQFTMLLQGELRPSDVGIYVLPEILYRVIAAKSIERVADHAVLIASILMKPRGNIIISDDLRYLFGEARNLFLKSSKAYLSLDTSLALQARIDATKFWRREEATRSKLMASLYLPDITSLLDSVRRIAAYSSDLAEATLNIAEIRGASRKPG